MSGFKEMGQFIATEVAPELKNGGVDFYDKESEFPRRSVRHPDYRLRQIGQENTTNQISRTDIDPIKLHGSDDLKQEVKIPEHPDLVKSGIEVEFTVIDKSGKRVNLYEGDTWLLDEIGLSPEALKFIGEIAFDPATTWDEMEMSIYKKIAPIYLSLNEKGLLLLPAGNSGEFLENNKDNITPHPYIVNVHQNSMHGTTYMFDTTALQTHNDLEPFGSTIDFGIQVANFYNGSLATMQNAITTSAPFNSGYMDGLLSHRENQRRLIHSKGGVQKYIEIDGEEFLKLGDQKIRNGEIPVPERAVGSHNDTRVKLTTGTFEACASDMTANINYWLAQTYINKQFIVKVAESIKKGDNIELFMIQNAFELRVQNRNNASRYGNRAEIRTLKGLLKIEEAWQYYFEWAKPKEVYNYSWIRSVDAVQKMLISPAPASAYRKRAIEMYLTPGWEGYLAGNQSEIMRTYANSIQGESNERIRATNLELATYFMKDLGRRIKEKELI